MILVGQALEKCHPAAPPEYSGDHRPFQLWTVKVRVEQIVQGDLKPGILDLFYFVEMGFSSGGWSRLMDIQKGSSEIFFLQRDNDKLRTICDGWRSCVLWVRSGSHYKFEVNPDMPTPDILVNLMLSRGDHTSDAQMIDAIYHPETRWGSAPVINKLRQLADRDQSPLVRGVALNELRKYQKWFGNGNRVMPDVRF